MAWISANLSTILISLALISVFALVVFSMVRDRRKGKSGCPSGCAGCALSGTCHKKESGDSGKENLLKSKG